MFETVDETWVGVMQAGTDDKIGDAELLFLASLL